MKAIVVRQPWATLIALGIKTIETRPAPPNGPMRPDGVRGLPGLAVERGERIAIVAGATEPTFGLRAGEWGCWLDDDPMGEMPTRDRWVLYSDRGQGSYPLPLGAVVCTVVVGDALPVVADLAWCDDGGVGIAGAAISLSDGEDAALYLHNGDHFGCGGQDIPDQRPLGDFTPGRWGWMLSDPRPCDPIPCKGRQGVFRLPDDVAAVLGGAK